MNKIAEILKKTSFVVFWFAGVLAVVLLLQALPAIFMFITANFGISLVVLNAAVKMPVDLTAWFFMSIAALYTGVDRFVYYNQSKKLKYGEANCGDPAKLRKVIYMSFLLFVEAAILELVFSTPMPLEALMSAFGSTCLFYVTGQKGIRGAGAVEGSHATGHVEFYTNQEYADDPMARDDADQASAGDGADVTSTPDTLKSPSGADLPSATVLNDAVDKASATPDAPTDPKKNIIDTIIGKVADYASEKGDSSATASDSVVPPVITDAPVAPATTSVPTV